MIIRYLTGEPREMFEKVVMLMDAVENGDVTLRVDEITIAEVVWVLSTSYKLKPLEVATGLMEFLARDGIETDEAILSALTIYGSRGIDYADAFLAARSCITVRVMSSASTSTSTDPGIVRLEPGVGVSQHLLLTSVRICVPFSHAGNENRMDDESIR